MPKTVALQKLIRGYIIDIMGDYWTVVSVSKVANRPVHTIGEYTYFICVLELVNSSNPSETASLQMHGNRWVKVVGV